MSSWLRSYIRWGERKFGITPRLFFPQDVEKVEIPDESWFEGRQFINIQKPQQPKKSPIPIDLSPKPIEIDFDRLIRRSTCPISATS